LQGCVIVVLQGCVARLRYPCARCKVARLRDCAMLILKISATYPSNWTKDETHPTHPHPPTPTTK
jgi:hypothetical protein